MSTRVTATVVCCILMQILCVVSQKSFSFWGTLFPRPPTGAPPLDPAGGLLSPSLQIFYVPPIILWDRRPCTLPPLEAQPLMAAMHSHRTVFAQQCQCAHSSNTLFLGSPNHHTKWHLNPVCCVVKSMVNTNRLTDRWTDRPTEQAPIVWSAPIDQYLWCDLKIIKNKNHASPLSFVELYEQLMFLSFEIINGICSGFNRLFTLSLQPLVLRVYCR